MKRSHAAVGHYPVEIVFGPGVSGRVANLAPAAGAKTDNSVLDPFLSWSLHAVLLDQRSARITVAGTLAAGGVNAHHAGSDDAVHVVAVAVGDHRQVVHHAQHWRNAAGRVGGLAPPDDGDHVAGGGGVTRRRHARRLDVVVKGDGLGQLDQGQIVGEVRVVPLGVGESVEGGDLHAVGLAGGAHVVGPGPDVKVEGAVGAVGRGQDVVLVEQGAAAEVGVVDEHGHDPGELVFSGLFTADNLVEGGGTLDTALGRHRLHVRRLGGEPVASQLLGLLGELDDVLLPCDVLHLLGEHGVPRLVLADVAGPGRAPVLLGTQPTSLREGQGHGSEKGEGYQDLHGDQILIVLMS